MKCVDENLVPYAILPKPFRLWIHLQTTANLERPHTWAFMTNKSKLIFFCGKMASGKSTLAAKTSHEEKAILIVEDYLLATLYPGEILNFTDFVKCDGRVRASLSSHICSILTAGVSVVLDFPGNTRTQRAWFRELIAASGVDHELHWVDVSDDLCKRQLKSRSRHLPLGSPWTTEAEFESITIHFRAPEADESFNVIRHSEDRQNLSQLKP